MGSNHTTAVTCDRTPKSAWLGPGTLTCSLNTLQTTDKYPIKHGKCPKVRPEVVTSMRWRELGHMIEFPSQLRPSPYQAESLSMKEVSMRICLNL